MLYLSKKTVILNWFCLHINLQILYNKLKKNFHINIYSFTTENFCSTACIFPQNVFFYHQWMDDETIETILFSDKSPLRNQVKDHSKAPFLITAYKTKRSDPLPRPIRTKYIVRPETAIIVENHYVLRGVNGKEIC